MTGTLNARRAVLVAGAWRHLGTRTAEPWRRCLGLAVMAFVGLSPAESRAEPAVPAALPTVVAPRRVPDLALPATLPPMQGEPPRIVRPEPVRPSAKSWGAPQDVPTVTGPAPPKGGR